MSSPRVLVLALLSCLAAACTPTVRVTRWKPAEIPTRSGTRAAVLELGGNDGPALSGALQHGMSQGAFFQLVDRAALSAVLAEQRLVVDGVVSNDGSTRLGGLLGAQMLVAGDATATYAEDVSSYRQTCTRTRNGVRQDYPCTRYERTGRVTYSANLRVIDAATGQVTPRTYQETAQDTNTAIDASPPGIDATRLTAQGRDQVVGQFLRVIAPYPVVEEVELTKDGDLPQLEEGNRFARTDNWTAAAQRYGEALAVASQRHGKGASELRAKATYAVGVALVMQGDFEAGLEQLEAAANLWPEERYARMLQRARRWKGEADAVHRQNATATVGE